MRHAERYEVNTDVNAGKDSRESGPIEAVTMVCCGPAGVEAKTRGVGREENGRHDEVVMCMEIQEPGGFVGIRPNRNSPWACASYHLGMRESNKLARDSRDSPVTRLVTYRCLSIPGKQRWRSSDSELRVQMA